MQEKDDELIQFQKKQHEIRLLNFFWQLSMIQKYKDAIVTINQEFESNPDLLQTNRLEQVEELKRDLVEVRADDNFELIYSLKQI